MWSGVSIRRNDDQLNFLLTCGDMGGSRSYFFSFFTGWINNFFIVKEQTCKFWLNCKLKTDCQIIIIRDYWGRKKLKKTSSSSDAWFNHVKQNHRQDTDISPSQEKIFSIIKNVKVFISSWWKPKSIDVCFSD